MRFPLCRDKHPNRAPLEPRPHTPPPLAACPAPPHVLDAVLRSHYFRASLKPVHARTLPSIREINTFVYSVTMTFGLVVFVGVSYSFLKPVGLSGVWAGLTRTELTNRMDYYQNFFKAIGVAIVVLYSYEIVVDLRCGPPPGGEGSRRRRGGARTSASRWPASGSGRSSANRRRLSAQPPSVERQPPSVA